MANPFLIRAREAHANESCVALDFGIFAGAISRACGVGWVEEERASGAGVEVASFNLAIMSSGFSV